MKRGVSRGCCIEPESYDLRGEVQTNLHDSFPWKYLLAMQEADSRGRKETSPVLLAVAAS